MWVLGLRWFFVLFCLNCVFLIWKWGFYSVGLFLGSVSYDLRDFEYGYGCYEWYCDI